VRVTSGTAGSGVVLEVLLPSGESDS
jgi:hypothetical protein